MICLNRSFRNLEQKEELMEQDRLESFGYHTVALPLS